MCQNFICKYIIIRVKKMNYHAINHEYKEKHISELKTFPSAKDETSLTYFQTIFDLLLLKNSQPKI